MYHNLKEVERMNANPNKAQEMARERIRLWFEQHERPFAISKRSSHSETWIMLIAVLCAGALFRNQVAVMQALSSIHSALGV
jgi:hypothetical protein